jgi:hypothetical protein
MTDTDPPNPDPQTADPQAAAPEGDGEAQRAAAGLKGQIAALRDQVRQARADLLNAPKPKTEPRSFKD